MTLIVVISLGWSLEDRLHFLDVPVSGKGLVTICCSYSIKKLPILQRSCIIPKESSFDVKLDIIFIQISAQF